MLTLIFLNWEIQIPTLYELMTKPNLDIWDGSSAIEDEAGDGWKTYINKKSTKAIGFSYFNAKFSKNIRKV